eukprot:TRINITY_DN2508_c0_g1_i1.p1 TRINITY_DN2508_c0_g1~~TRINITY_DN2508_c0_g1_i1.p1  ORF type:complete len:680 (-),score=58.23 TRINITY_DN2508_c0_g1_i1:154-1959(-)
MDFGGFLNHMRNWTEFYLMTLVDERADETELMIKQGAVLKDLDNHTHFFWLPYTFQVFEMKFDVTDVDYKGARQSISTSNIPKPPRASAKAEDEYGSSEEYDVYDTLSSFVMPFDDFYLGDFGYSYNYDYEYYSEEEESMLKGINNVMQAFGITYESQSSQNEAEIDELLNFAGIGRLGSQELFGGRRRLLQLIRDEISVPAEFFFGLDDDLYEIEEPVVVHSGLTASQTQTYQRLYQYYTNNTSIKQLVKTWKFNVPEAPWKSDSMPKIQRLVQDYMKQGPPLFRQVEEWQKLFTFAMKEWVNERSDVIFGSNEAFQDLNPFHKVIKMLQDGSSGSFLLPFEQIEMAIPLEMAGECLTHIGELLYNTTGEVDNWIFPITLRFQGKEDAFLSASVDGPRMWISTEIPLAEIDSTNLLVNNSLVMEVFDYLFVSCKGRLHWGLGGWDEFGSCFDGFDRYGDNWCRFGCAEGHMDPLNKFASQADHIWQWYARNQLVYVQDFKSSCCDEGGVFNKKWCQCSSHPDWYDVQDCRTKAKLKQDTPNKLTNPLLRYKKEEGGQIDEERILDLFSDAQKIVFVDCSTVAVFMILYFTFVYFEFIGLM